MYSSNTVSLGFDDLVPKSSNWQSSLPPTRTPSTVGTTAGVIGLLGGLAGITFAIDLVLYMVYRQRKWRTEKYRNNIGRREINAVCFYDYPSGHIEIVINITFVRNSMQIALTPPPSRRPVHTILPPRDAPPPAPERTHRLESTPIFI